MTIMMQHRPIGLFPLRRLEFGPGTGREQEPPGFEGEEPADPPEVEL